MESTEKIKEIIDIFKNVSIIFVNTLNDREILLLEEYLLNNGDIKVISEKLGITKLQLSRLIMPLYNKAKNFS
jgi:DNA-directed RNA polymerase specialized sigma subunit